MGNTRDQVGKAGLFVAGGIFRTAFYVCVAVLIFWIGKSAYQFGYNVFNQQAVSPGAGQEVTVVIPEGSSTYDVAKILKSKGLIDDSLVFFAQEKLSTYKGQMQAGTYLLSTAYTPTRIMGILAGDEEQTGVTQDSATAADTAAQTDTQTTDAGTDTADTQSADGTADTSETSLRFGYQINVKNDASIAEWGWKYGVVEATADKLPLSAKGKNQIKNNEGFVSNLVVTAITPENYTDKIYETVYVTYRKDSKTYTVTGSVENRSVQDVVNAILNSSTATKEEKAYANALNEVIDNKNWTSYY